jgi:hypothetical protein
VLHCRTKGGGRHAIRFIPKAEHMRLLVQFGKYEQYFERSAAEHYAATAREPKRVLWYDTDHELNDPKCLLDRYAWLMEQIGLTGDFRL